MKKLLALMAGFGLLTVFAYAAQDTCTCHKTDLTCRTMCIEKLSKNCILMLTCTPQVSMII